MINAINDDIKKSIEANLPSAVGDVLTERLKLIDSLEERNKALNQKINEADHKIKGYIEREKLSNSYIEELESLKKREFQIYKREQDQEIFELKTILKANGEKEMLATEYMKMIFSNNIVKSTVHSDRNTNKQREVMENGYATTKHNYDQLSINESTQVEG